MVNWSSVSHTLRQGALSRACNSLPRPPGQCTGSLSSSGVRSPQSTGRILQKTQARCECMNFTTILESMCAGKWVWKHFGGLLPCVVSGCWLCWRSMGWFASYRAESRLQQRGWSSLGGLMASSFSSSEAELRWAGFLSRARPRKVRMTGLQSSAMSSKGGACLWIWWEEDHRKVSIKKKSCRITTTWGREAQVAVTLAKKQRLALKEQ